MNSLSYGLKPFTSVTNSSLRRFASRRFASISPSFVQPSSSSKHSNKAAYVHKYWLSDPSTYPLMIIMGSALTFMTGMGIHALVDYKDVKLSSTRRNAMLQNWGYEPQGTVVKAYAGWNAYPPEGLGVNHEDWKKQKEEYMHRKTSASE